MQVHSLPSAMYTAMQNTTYFIILQLCTLNISVHTWFLYIARQKGTVFFLKKIPKGRNYILIHILSFLTGNFRATGCYLDYKL